jgi:hypothetical protein
MLLQTKIVSVPQIKPKKHFFLPRIAALVLSNAVLALSSCANPLNSPEIIIQEEYVPWCVPEGNNYSPEEWAECLAVIEQLQVLGITKPEFFNSLNEAKYIIEQRTNLTNRVIDPAKPVTVAMYPRYDKNGVFSARWNSLGDIIARPTQQLLFFEINSDASLKSALRLLKDNLPAGQKFVLLLSGHGTKDLLQWDHGTVAYYLDPTDYNDLEFTNLLHSLNITLVIFESCKAGEGAEAVQNQANRMAAHIQTGGSVIAPLISVYKQIYIFNQDNSIKIVAYDAGEPGIIYEAAGNLVL